MDKVSGETPRNTGEVVAEATAMEALVPEDDLQEDSSGTSGFSQEEDDELEMRTYGNGKLEPTLNEEERAGRLGTPEEQEWNDNFVETELTCSHIQQSVEDLGMHSEEKKSERKPVGKTNVYPVCSV